MSPKPESVGPGRPSVRPAERVGQRTVSGATLASDYSRPPRGKSEAARRLYRQSGRFGGQS
jgi:hypothetical protein